MSNDLPVSGSAHPAPQRNETQDGALWLSVVGTPIVWALHLLVNYVIAGQNCSASASGAVLTNGHVTTMLLIDLAAIILATVAGYVALKYWRRTQSEKGGGAKRLVHTGEGRTRFIAMCGMLSSGLLGLAVVIDAIGTIVGPPC